MAFIIDTDALVHFGSRPDGDDIYEALRARCLAGEILTVSQVFGELKRWPEVRERFWPLRNEMKVDQYDDAVLRFVGYISDTFDFLYDLSGSKNPDPADPWLIACARVFRHTLVTDERQNSVKKIPFVCRQQGVDVECVNGVELLNRLGYDGPP